jgi:hypothetical protein
MAKRSVQSKKTKDKSEAETFENVARKLFKVPKSEITQKDKKA